MSITDFLQISYSDKHMLKCINSLLSLSVDKDMFEVNLTQGYPQTLS